MSEPRTTSAPPNREAARRGLAALLRAVDPLTLPPPLRHQRNALLRLYALRDEARAAGQPVKRLTYAALRRLGACLEKCAAAEAKWVAKRDRWGVTA